MTIKITKQLGDANIAADIDIGSDMPKALVGADWLLNAPSFCTVCGKSDLHFSSRRSVGKNGANAGKEFFYAQMRCKTAGCYATATIGKFQDGSGYFWRDGGKFVQYQPEGNAQSYNQGGSIRPNTQPVDEPSYDDGDIPF